MGISDPTSRTASVSFWMNLSPCKLLDLCMHWGWVIFFSHLLTHKNKFHHLPILPTQTTYLSGPSIHVHLAHLSLPAKPTITLPTLSKTFTFCQNLSLLSKSFISQQNFFTSCLNLYFSEELIYIFSSIFFLSIFYYLAKKNFIPWLNLYFSTKFLYFLNYF
jgi:hypothetical protein